MARGFADIQRNSVKEDSGYQTIFEKVTEATAVSYTHLTLPTKQAV